MRNVSKPKTAEALLLWWLVSTTVFAAQGAVRIVPVDVAYGLSDGIISGMVVFFATCGWIMGKFHEAVLYRQGDAVAKARIVQGIVASYIAAIFAFWVATPYAHYPLLAGCGAATLCAYLGVRAIELLGAIGLEGLKAVAARFLNPGGKAP